MGRKGRPTAPELVARLVEIGVEVLVRQLGVPEVQAKEAMREIAHGLCREYGGQRLSIPQDMEYPLEQRDERLYAAFTGDNIPELVALFGLTAQQVRNIVAHKRRQNAARRQMVLGLEEATS